MSSITENLIKARTGTFDLETVFTLSLTSLGISNLDPILNQCKNMWHLDLSENRLGTLRSLNGHQLTQLKVINVINNSLRDLRDFPALPALQTLYLQGNRIESLEQLSHLATTCPNLTGLYMKQINGTMANPACSTSQYREKVLKILPSLHILDGERVRRDGDLTRAASDIRTLLQGGTLGGSASASASAANEAKATSAESWLSADPASLMSAEEFNAGIQPRITSVKAGLADLHSMDADAVRALQQAEALTKQQFV